MKINSDKLMQNALIVFLDIQSIKKKNDLENGMDEFRRLEIGRASCRERV